MSLEETGRTKPAPPAPLGRIASLDQFRGYAVAMMFVVNFCGGLKAIPDWIKHHDTYFSYADSIMPAFLFASGVSYRLTMLRRIDRQGASAAYRHALLRGLGLVLVSLAMYGFNDSFPTKWDAVTRESVREFLAALLKANLWETLAVIGACQILVLPFIAARTRIVALTFVAFLAAHTLMSHSFNFRFVYGQPNWVSDFWGAEKTRCWDGGFFGTITWSAIMLAGALAHDILIGRRPGKAAAGLMSLAIVLMGAGYGLSCLTTLYDVPEGTAVTGDKLAASPVFPTREQLDTHTLRPAEPPFVAPPPPEHRRLNYWMMSKRIVTTSFALFASGFSMASLALFVVVSDIGGTTLGLLRTFGQNPLAAYFLHHAVEVAVLGIVPKDSPLWWCLTGLALFYVVTYTFVRFLERQGCYIRL
jgi:predicted acyltransferase